MGRPGAVGQSGKKAGVAGFGGPLTAVALWAALNSLSSPSSVDYFHNYQYDPGYMQWRREADREAGHSPTVAAKLDQLESVPLAA